ncbi:MAG: adenylate/guanylate cyclase domain-containing protein [bacterium]|nr:adenylate/guanylate cyclase domain-containing protein [bacterium]
MSLKDELESKVKSIFSEQWTERDGQVVPSVEDLKLGNDAVKLDGVVLYADMSESTKLVDSKKAFFAAEIYKAYLHCTAKIIEYEGGEITAYDGDRIMAVFIGDSKNTSAVKAALKINYSRIQIVNPAIKNQYKDETYQVKHTIGIDSSNLFIARTGIRGSNDLVWVGKAANHAAKLCELSNDYTTRITADVYNNLHQSVKYFEEKSMWEKVTWIDMNKTIYCSTWWWSVS